MSSKLQPSDILVLNPTAQLILLPDQRILIRHKGGLTLLNGIDWEMIEKIQASVDGIRTVQTIYQELKQQFGPAFKLNILQQLFGEMLVLKNEQNSPATIFEPNTGSDYVVLISSVDSKIAVLANGTLGDILRDKLKTSFPYQSIVTTNIDEFGALMQELDFVIVALEDTAYKLIFDLQKTLLLKKVNALFITSDPDGIRIGPTVMPGLTPCFGCAQLSGYPFKDFPASESLVSAGNFRTMSFKANSSIAVPKMLRIITSEVNAFLMPDTILSTHSAFHLVSSNGQMRFVKFLQHKDCPLCSHHNIFEENAASNLLNKVKQVNQQSSRLIEQSRMNTNQQKPLKVPIRIGILGGGTAGYLTALALRKKLPWLELTIIESSKLPIIGVGEATTPLMPQFLHVDLGLDIHEFFKQVKPTLKLGIRFEWGNTKEDYFHYPFGPNLNMEAYNNEGTIQNNSLWSMLMAEGKVPVATDGSNDLYTYLDTHVAYHLDNKRFVAYLKEKLELTGLRHVDAKINEVSLTEDQQNIQSLIAEDGRRFNFDLYIDCSGFSSVLMGKNIGSEFLSFKKSLFTDCAIIANVAHGGIVKPYTTAEAMSAGWCWNTPQPDSDHRGYVFCSSFQSPEQAAEEMRQKNPGMEAWKLIKFRSGRRRHFWKGNVVAMGNAYGFVEPLESTALHMLIRQIGLLADVISKNSHEKGIQLMLNRKVGEYWDYVSWFLALHFKYNQKQNTPFWKTCREETDVSRYGELIELFQERGPLAYQPKSSFSFEYPDPLWGADGIDTILMGQQVKTPSTKKTHDISRWQHWLKRNRQLVQQSFTQAEVLEQFEKRPELLTQMFNAFNTVGPAFKVERMVNP